MAEARIGSALKPTIRQCLANSQEPKRLDPTSTALTLGLLLPQMIGTTEADRLVYLDRFAAHDRFQDLVNLIENALSTSPETALSYEHNPEVFRLAAEIGLAVKNELSPDPDSASFKLAGPMIECFPCFSDCNPKIEDVAGSSVIFENPKFIYIGCGIYNYSDLHQIDVLSLSPRGFHWLIIPEDPTEETYSLGDGQFTIRFFRGFTDLPGSTWAQKLDPKHPGGRATLYNTGLGVWHIADLFLGIPFPKTALTIRNFKKLDDIKDDIEAADAFEAIIDISQLLLDNAGEIMYWFYQESTNPAEFAEFTSRLSGLVKNLTIATRVINAATKIPYICDIVGTL
jgi:hypothetical protein